MGKEKDRDDRRHMTVDDNKDRGNEKSERAQSQSPPKGQSSTEMVERPRPQAAEIVASGGPELQHLTVELDFFQQKAEKLFLENDTLRNTAFLLEAKIRGLESKAEEQNKLLKYAEIDLQSPVQSPRR